MYRILVKWTMLIMLVVCFTVGSVSFALASDQASELERQGRECLEKGQYQEAVNYFTQAINLNPQVAGFYQGRGEAYDKLDYYGLAIADFNSAIKIDPGDSNIYVGRGWVFHKNMQFEPARDDFLQAVQLDANNKEAWNGLGWTDLRLQDFAKAKNAFSQAIALDPNRPDFYDGLGRAYLELEDFEKALDSFNKSLAIQPDANVYEGRGEAHMNLEQYDQAVMDFTSAISLNPDILAAFYYRAQCYAKLGQNEPALADYTSIIKQIDDADVYLERGRLYRQMQQFAAAIGDFSKAIALRPDDFILYNERGFCLLINGKYTPAIADFEAALQLKTNAESITNIGYCYLLSGDHPHAVMPFSQALDSDPNSVKALLGRGWNFEYLGDRKAADADLTTLHNINPAADKVPRAILAKILCEQLKAETVNPEHTPDYAIMKDVPRDLWSAKYIYTACKNGWMHPLNGEFRITEPVTRAELAASVQKALQIPDYNPPVSDFRDVAISDPGYTAIEAVTHAGLMDADNLFRPNDNARLLEILKVFRCLKDTPAYTEWDKKTFDRVPSGRHWHIILNASVDLRSVNESNIFISKQDTGVRHPVKVTVVSGKDGKEIEVTPQQPYLSQGSYCLYIQKLNSQDNRRLQKDIKVPFTVN